ncbi:MAG: FecR domain-containing protein, partial [Rickettsiales bacterium]|nr:FecR domain-containing protein [Rickettsiales bacterium]
MSDNTIFNTPLTHSTPSEQIALDCTALQGPCELPLGNELLDAKFTREGQDLLVTAPSKLVIAENYFTHETAPTLISDTGKKIEGTSVTALSSAEAPKEYAGPVSSEPSIGVVEKLAGVVTVKRGGVDVELKQGDAVFQNDVIQTANNSKIGITFEDGSVFTLGSDARMTLDSFVYDAETGDGSSSINVLKGMFKFVSGEIAANNPGEMQVETPVATIGIRGTTGGGSVQGEGLENEFFLEPNADGTVGWFDVITDQGTTSMNQPNTVVEVTSFHEAPPAPEF